MELWSKSLLMNTKEEQKPAVAIYTGSYSAINNSIQPTDVSILYPPSIGDAVGMAMVNDSYTKISAITNSSVAVLIEGYTFTASYKGIISMGGKPMKWFFAPSAYFSFSYFCSPGAIAGDYCLVNDVGGFYTGYPTIKAFDKNSITISYYATGNLATINFKEFKKDFIYRE